jgi:hypothetical protein
MRAALAILALIATPACAQPADDTAQPELPTLYVGVRGDAPPFSYRPDQMLVSSGKGTGPLGDAGYSGYIVYICDRVLEVMRDRNDQPAFNVVPVEVTAGSRFQMLREIPGGGDPSIDLLCDPATATRERLRDHTASLPLYLSGVGYAARKRERNQNTGSGNFRINVVGSTTAIDHGIRRILDAGEWPSFRDDLLSYLYNPGAATDGNEKVRLSPTHKAAVEAFCAAPSGDSNPLQYYVGDLEIVNRALLIYGDPDCKPEPATTTYSDDRYVLFMRNADSVGIDKARLLMTFSRVLSELVLSQPSLLDEAFEANFEGYRRSDKLRLFFWSLYGP